MEREVIVDELLLDAGLTGAPDVRQALLSIRSFANLPAPAPNGALAAMLAGPHDEVSKRRWRHKHRTAVVSVAVVAAMGLGVSGVAAASSGFTRTPAFINELLGDFAPPWSAAAPVQPTPDAPKVTTEQAPAVDPAAVPLASGSPAATQTRQADDSAGTSVPVQTTGQPAATEAHAADVENVPAIGDSAESRRSAKAEPGEAGLPDVGKPIAAPPATAKPAPAHGNKPNQALPSLNEKPAHDQFPSFKEKLKQWLRGAGH
jgi:hypothetical protein